MRPVDDSPFRVPFVLAFEGDGIAGAQVLDARGDVNVVRDQHRLSRRKAHEEALMAASLVIVGKECGDPTFTFDIGIAATVRERPGEGIRGRGSAYLRSARLRAIGRDCGGSWSLKVADDGRGDERGGEYRTFHSHTVHRRRY